MHNRIQFLFERYFNKTATAAERAELMTFLTGDGHTNEVLAAMQQAWNAMSEEEQGILSNADAESILQRVVPAAANKNTIGMRRWWTAAAAVLLIAAGAWWWSMGTGKGPVRTTVALQHIPPGHSGAVLTLANGTTILLDSTGKGIIAAQEQTQLVLEQGRLVYRSPAATAGAAASFNTLHTPKGRSFQLSLPDGTKVWLNAASSIRYPVAFSSKERVVEVAGEAYFEVARNAAAPFRVNTATQQLTVLGTQFNINAYENEQSVTTTLVQGSVQVAPQASGNAPAIAPLVLAPAEQARLTTAGVLTKQSIANTGQVIAWKNGVFNFHRLGLQEVMRQIERWYDVDVVYGKNIPPIRFGGEMGMDLNLADVLQFLKESDIPFRVEGRTLILGS